MFGYTIRRTSDRHPEAQTPGGLAIGDLDLIRRHQSQRAPKTGYYTSFLGVRTDVEMFEGYRGLSGTVENFSSLGSHEAVEIAGSLRAVEATTGNTFSVAEIGAGWGPWILTSAVAARNRGATDIYMAAIEADSRHFRKLAKHIADNDFDPNRQLLVHGAIAPKDGFAFFPSEQEREDWGAAAIFGEETQSGTVTDYRGVPLPHSKIQALSIKSLLAGRDIFDLVHVDIQGSERVVLPAAIDTLNTKVKWLVVGTHSRPIEGILLELFSRAGWILTNERPCEFIVPNFVISSYESLTTHDGTQVWMNPRHH